MSVFTSVSQQQLEDFLSHYGVGNLVEYRGIEDGIENSNFFVTTTGGDAGRHIGSEFVLTLFERVDPEDLPFFMTLTATLASRGVACMYPIADSNGDYVRTVSGKNAALVKRLAGGWLKAPELKHYAPVGAELARLHLAGSDFPIQRVNGFGKPWLRQVIDQVKPLADDSATALMTSQMQEIEAHDTTDLPRGIIHADLFQDNVLFDGDRLTGIIDFYYACSDVLVYDLAITINDWCTDDTGLIDPVYMKEMMHGYESVRPLTQLEKDAMPIMFRRAAFRFWLSRLRDKLFPRTGEMVLIKDPDVFRRILENHRAIRHVA